MQLFALGFRHEGLGHTLLKGSQMKIVIALLMSLSACLPLTQSPLSDKQKVQISGRILDIQGNPAVQQGVTLHTSGEDYRLTTDAQGRYQADLLGMETKSSVFGSAIDLKLNARLQGGAEINYQQKVLTEIVVFPDLRFWSGLSEPADGQQQRGGTQVFRWQAPTALTPPQTYAFQLKDSRGQTLWYQTSEILSVSIPGEVFQTNGIYSWQVSTQGQPRLTSVRWVLNGPATAAPPRTIVSVRAEEQTLAYLHDGAFDQTHPFPSTGGELPHLPGPLQVDLGSSQPLQTLLVHSAKGWSGQVQVQISEDPNRWGESVARLTPQGSWTAPLKGQRGRYLRLSTLDNPRGFLDVSEVQVF